VIEVVAVGPRQTIYGVTWRKVRRTPGADHPDCSQCSRGIYLRSLSREERG
jgi:hypothetical protein